MYAHGVSSCVRHVRGTWWQVLEQLEARSRLLEAAAGREEQAREAWADERREWAARSRLAADEAAAKQEELRGALSESRRLVEEAQV